jgi:enoyl-CoA hydratase/carnithine racemase
MTDYADVLYEVKDRIATITLNRPDKLNAWTAAMETSVKRAIADAARDDTVRAIVITGAGRGFCAGADMGVLQSIGPKGERGQARDDAAPVNVPSSPHGPSLEGHYNSRFGYLFGVGKPIIAAINGPCAGIGLVFTLFCDLRFASHEAKFTTAFAQRGLIAEHGISWLLPRLTGSAHALDVLLSARKFSAEEAQRIGLINRAFAHHDFMENVLAYARQLAETVSPRSMAVMKKQVWKAWFQDFNEALRVADAEMQKSFGSEDFKEGVAHFVEKRTPKFSGR